MTTTASLPVLALTLGDVAGIGPEITAKTLLHHADLRGRVCPGRDRRRRRHADRRGAGRPRSRLRQGHRRPARSQQRPQP